MILGEKYVFEILDKLSPSNFLSVVLPQLPVIPIIFVLIFSYKLEHIQLKN